MKYRFSGLVIVVLAVACGCVALVFPEFGVFEKTVCWVLAALFFISGALILKKESEKEPSEVQKNEPVASRYASKDAILTAPERALLGVLRGLYGGRYEILPQVALVSLVDKLNYTSYRNELFRIVDFVIADGGFCPLVVIELNDKSHLRADRAERDRKVADILQKAELPLVTLTPDEASDVAYVRRSIGRYLK